MISTDSIGWFRSVGIKGKKTLFKNVDIRCRSKLRLGGTQMEAMSSLLKIESCSLLAIVRGNRQ